MPQQFSTLIPIALLVVAFYFLILRPQKKRQQALQKTMRALEPGAHVLLGSGLFGTIVTIGDKQAVLEIAPGVHLTVLKQAIVRTVTDADLDAPEEEDELESGYAAGTADEPDYSAASDYSTTNETTTFDNHAPEPVAPAPDASVASDQGVSGSTPSGTESERNNLR